MNAPNLRTVLIASVSGFALAVPAAAAAQTFPGVEHDVLTISLPGDPQVIHGDIEHGTASATAVLNFSGGQIIQIGFGSGTGTASGNADLTIENSGSALLIASAVASNPGG